MDQNKIALITGAGRGLGAAVSEYMYSHGMRVILVDKDKINLKNFSAKNENILSYQVDVSKRMEVKKKKIFCCR